MEYHHNHIANNMRNQEDQMTILPSPSTTTTRSTSSAASSSSNWPPSASASAAPSAAPSTPLPDRELMFEKVVTPSDVGKLNRLVIPKQHAERYFPLDPSSADRGAGLLLNFEEDRTGRPWRFRYSYWNSSQSYVITKGWSRFVKDKHLRAGDTVSFSRADAGRRLFIDWRRRPFLDPHPALLPAWAAAAAWNTNAAYHLPAPPLHPPPPLYFRTSMSMSPMLPPSQQLHGVDHRILDSVPVVAGGPMFEPRRHVRLFGVNLDECSAAEQQEDRSVSPLQWRLSAAATPRARTHGELQLMPPPSMEESRR